VNSRANRDPQKTYNPQTLAQLKELAPSMIGTLTWQKAAYLIPSDDDRAPA